MAKHYQFKADRRHAQRQKARSSTPTTRAFLHTLDRLAAERDRATTQPAADKAARSSSAVSR
jgi:hypothetical protein